VDLIDVGLKSPQFKDQKEFAENLRKLRLSLTAPNRKNSTPKILSNNSDSNTPMSSHDEFREQLTKESKSWDTNFIKQKIDDWSILKNEGRYVDILENELKSREK
jgi:hypothetical protein